MSLAIVLHQFYFVLTLFTPVAGVPSSPLIRTIICQDDFEKKMSESWILPFEKTDPRILSDEILASLSARYHHCWRRQLEKKSGCLNHSLGAFIKESLIVIIGKSYISLTIQQKITVKMLPKVLYIFFAKKCFLYIFHRQRWICNRTLFNQSIFAHRAMTVGWILTDLDGTMVMSARHKRGSLPPVQQVPTCPRFQKKGLVLISFSFHPSSSSSSS